MTVSFSKQSQYTWTENDGMFKVTPDGDNHGMMQVVEGQEITVYGVKCKVTRLRWADGYGQYDDGALWVKAV